MSANQAAALSHNSLIGSFEDILRQHQGSMIAEIGDMLSANKADMNEDFHEYTAKSLEAASETQNDVAGLAAEISSLRQAQLSLRQQLNHDKRKFEIQAVVLEDAFRSELRAAVDRLKEEFRSTRDELQHSKQETHVLRSEIQTLRKQVSCSPRFPQFSKLPPEIRHLVWNFALPSRIVEVGGIRYVGRHTSGSSWSFAKKQPPPAIAQVCREARSVASYTGRLMRIDNTKAAYTITAYNGEGVDIDSDDAHRARHEPSWSWFDSSRDRLYLVSNEHMDDYDAEFLRPISELASCATHVMLYAERDSRYLSDLKQVFVPANFPCLERVDLVQHEHGFMERADPTLETLICGVDGDPVCVDLDESEKFLEHLRSLHSSPLIDILEKSLAYALGTNWLHPSSRVDDEGEDLEYGLGTVSWLQTSYTAEEAGWRGFSNKLRQWWLDTQHYWTPLDGSPGIQLVSVEVHRDWKIKASRQWLAETVSRMPSIHRIMLIRLKPWHTW